MVKVVIGSDDGWMNLTIEGHAKVKNQKTPTSENESLLIQMLGCMLTRMSTEELAQYEIENVQNITVFEALPTKKGFNKVADLFMTIASGFQLLALAHPKLIEVNIERRATDCDLYN